jgi:nucleotide-binding universal stress UspA family protein
MAEIVVGVDGSDESQEALRWALEEARLRSASVRAVYAWRDPHVPTPGFGLPEDFDFDSLRSQAEAFLTGVVREAVGESSDVPITEVTAEGSAGRVLVQAAEGADLLVVGSRGHGGFTGLLLGSVSQQCAPYATCPVVIVRGTETS